MSCISLEDTSWMQDVYKKLLFKLILVIFLSFFLHQTLFFILSQKVNTFKRRTLIQSQRLNWLFQMCDFNSFDKHSDIQTCHWHQQYCQRSRAHGPCMSFQSVKVFHELIIAHIYIWLLFQSPFINSVDLGANCRKPTDSVIVFKIYDITENQSAVSL